MKLLNRIVALLLVSCLALRGAEGLAAGPVLGRTAIQNSEFRMQRDVLLNSAFCNLNCVFAAQSLAGRGLFEPFRSFGRRLSARFGRTLFSGFWARFGQMPAIAGADTTLIREALADPGVRPLLKSLHGLGVTRIDLRIGKDFNFFLNRMGTLLTIQLEDWNIGEIAFDLGFACRAALRALGDDRHLEHMSEWDLLADDNAGRAAIQYGVSGPIWKTSQGKKALLDFLNNESPWMARLRHRARAFPSKGFLASGSEVIQWGTFQVIVLIRYWVPWQNTPIVFIASMAKAPPGIDVEDPVTGRRHNPDRAAQDEAMNFQRDHPVSPDLYDLPLDSGYGHYGSGKKERIFIHLIPYRPRGDGGVYEMAPELHMNATGEVYRRFFLNTARRIATPGALYWDRVAIEAASIPMIDLASVAATVRHWARGMASAEGQGTVDDRFWFSAGDQNIQAIIGPETATVPAGALTARVAHRGRRMILAGDMVEYLTAPVEERPVHAAGSAANRRGYLYWAGNPDEREIRDLRLFHGIRLGLWQTGLDQAVRRALEIRLWSEYTSRHAARVQAVFAGVDAWIHLASELASAVRNLEPDVSPDTMAETGAILVERWIMTDGFLVKGFWGHYRAVLIQDFIEWLVSDWPASLSLAAQNILWSQLAGQPSQSWRKLFPVELEWLSSGNLRCCALFANIVRASLAGRQEVRDRLLMRLEEEIRHERLMSLASRRLEQLA